MFFLILALGICLFGSSLFFNSRDMVSSLQDFGIRLTLLFCLAVWLGVFCLPTFKLNDLLLIGLLLFVIVACFTGVALQIRTDCITFLAGLTMGKLAFASLLSKPPIKASCVIPCFLAGLIILLAFASWWHLKSSNNFYPAGIRWTGLWDNPNDYGMLMSAGVLLAVGLLVDGRWQMADRSWALEAGSWKPRAGSWLIIVLVIAAVMMAVGLFFSYSRGAWLGTVVGLVYLAKQTKEKRKGESGGEKAGNIIWYVLPLIALAATVIWVFWHAISDDAPWYLKRMDFSRPSAQHRVAAWKAGFEIMRDHPFGVGWNNTVEIYQKNYSPPEDGAGAITTNDYLMLATQLGVPALVCFLVYVALQLGASGWKLGARRWKLADGVRTKEEEESNVKPEKFRIPNSEFGIKLACRTAVVAMLVEFWFDGGLFKLATASTFWILLELGSIESHKAASKFTNEIA